ncbi:peptidoglycan-binding protein [Cellulomonas humilata]|uniref:Peptidoglycan hydrolase-like protein with peptidoglycan-binding domain n=1 Tax=Cellulomonas humilata TaxID=144055 RepID=A0ABU0EEL6_9CELL|nr:peptidoglycan-binding domain-containing protein [Cellulomonas humilata]MDQ0373715.1 peptidoglycan hydrolase-like protein with peptidoglycan-binding domain [Cellulomonas humilata]
MTTSRRIAGLAVVLVVSLAACSAPSGAADPSATPAAFTTRTVARTDLVSTTTASGEVGHGTATAVAARVPGTLTWLAPVGSTVANGRPVYAVDARPVVRLPGASPAWRDLGPASDDGIDVRQLEQALTDLGHTAGLDLTVDEDWTSVTSAVVRRWQKSLGVAATGTVRLGDVMFTPQDVRIDEHLADLGALIEPGAPVLSVGATQRLITVALRTSQAALAPVGATASLTLPDGTATAGTVTATAVVTVDEQPQLRVTITPTDALVDGLVEGAPVEVGLDQTVATDVLVVPVTALVALADGGYGVQKVLADGTSQYVTVTTGAFAGTSVEVSGDDVAVGDEVVVSP